AVDELLQANRAILEALASAETAPDWDNFVAPLEDASERLNRAWGQVNHVNAVMNSPELREVYNANLPKVTQYYTELGQNQRLFEKSKQLKASTQFATLSREQRASELGNPEWDNTRLIDEIVALRREMAHLLGFSSFAEYSLAPKMADSPQQVLEFLNELAAKAKPYAERDLTELKEFARTELCL